MPFENFRESWLRYSVEFGPFESLHHTGRGFGAAANAGIRAASHEIVFLLNNDAVVTTGRLPPLLAAATAHSRAAAFQPKVLSLQDPLRFDCGGAAGGMIDAFGYPYALGRRHGRIEIDNGQHDIPRPIQWAVGGAVLLRRSPAMALGLFDEAFFMHMEEIDLCRRLRRAGSEVRSVPQSVVLHEGGHTLRTGSWRKTWLNHRNNWVLFIKNASLPKLSMLIAVRSLLVIPTCLFGLVKRDWRHPLASVLAPLWCLLHAMPLARRRAAARRAIQAARSEEAGRVENAPSPGG
jgi:GT2 family glycosyltransferase